MEIFRTDVRHVVLMLKLSNEKQQNHKNELEKLYRMIQKQGTIFAPYTNQLLKDLKEINESYKSLKKLLLETLIKNHERMCMKKASGSTTCHVVKRFVCKLCKVALKRNEIIHHIFTSHC